MSRGNGATSRRVQRLGAQRFVGADLATGAIQAAAPARPLHPPRPGLVVGLS